MIILEPFMSKALPIAVAVVLGGAALVPVYYATQHPTTEVGRKADKMLLQFKNQLCSWV